MAEQYHIIKRQLVDLSIDGRLEARRVQNDVSKILTGTLVPIIGSYLDTLSSPDEVHRIDRWEIDLGLINVNNLVQMEIELKERLSFEQPPLADVSQSATEKSSYQPGMPQSEAELIVYYLQTGTLPWWVKETSPVIFETAITNLLNRENENIKIIFKQIIEEAVTLKRLIYTSNDTLLYLIIEKLDAGPKADIKALKNLYKAIGESFNTTYFREAWWSALLKGALSKTASPGKILPVLKLFFASIEKEEAAALKNLNVNETAGQRKKLETKVERDLSESVTQKQTGPIPGKKFDGAAGLQQAPEELVAGKLNTQPGQQQKPVLADKGETGQDAHYPAHLGALKSSFNDTDKLYIHHSGLVLLWPFLPRFFSKIGLITDGRITDQSAQHKGCLLLQYLAMGMQWKPFEALNKLLCGMDLFEPIDVQVAITQDELDEADYLLNAVIANAPLWKTLSADGLRQAYLQREGILSTRDGNWLLQVKRETYDVLVDKLPWSNRVVKLPWMKNLIFVEWQLD
jgi:hypothetical protein